MERNYVFRNFAVPLNDEQLEKINRSIKRRHLKRGDWVAGLILADIAKNDPEETEAPNA